MIGIISRDYKYTPLRILFFNSYGIENAKYTKSLPKKIAVLAQKKKKKKEKSFKPREICYCGIYT